MRVNPATGISCLELGLEPDRQAGLGISWAARQLASVYSGMSPAPLAKEFETFCGGRRETDGTLAVRYAGIADELDSGLEHSATLQIGLDDLPFFRDALQYGDKIIEHLKFLNKDGPEASEPDIAIPEAMRAATKGLYGFAQLRRV